MRTLTPARIPPTAARMVEYLRDHGPTPARVLMQVFGLNLVATTTQHLRIARNCGQVCATRIGGAAPLWHVKEHADRAAQMERERVQAAKQRRLEASRLAKRKGVVKDLPVIQRPRVGPAPKLGPASVWEFCQGASGTHQEAA